MMGVTLAVVSVFGVLSASATGKPALATRTFMSCGQPPISGPYGSFPAQISYKRHPRHCAYSDDGSTARLVNLVAVQWHHWGKSMTVAWGEQVDNHDQDNNGFQRHRVRVVLSDPQPGLGRVGAHRLYYTRMRVVEPGGSGLLLHLFRPGDPPVHPGRS